MSQRMWMTSPAHPANLEVNPAMVTLARESRGVSQKDLADSISVTPGLISKIEHGFRSPTPDVLSEMSRLLRYPVDFFYLQDRVYGPGIGELFHRKRQDVPVRTLLKIHATVNVWRMHLTRMVAAVELPECRIPNIDIEEHDSNVEDIARSIRAHWQLSKGPIPNLSEAIEDAGGIVIPFDFETPRVDAVSHWVPPLPPLFFINSRSPTDRMRFTLAHEVGHMVLHQSSRSYIELTDASEAERQANRFASEFLMPERDIAHQLESITLPKLAFLKPYWKVSMAALLKRATTSGKISERRARTLWAEMSQKGYKRREPANLDIPSEHPSMLRELLFLYQSELGYTPVQMSKLLAADESEVRSWYFTEGHLRMMP